MQFIDIFIKNKYNIFMKQNYYKHKIENLILVSKIVTIHYFELAKNFRAKGIDISEKILYNTLVKFGKARRRYDIGSFS